MQFINVYFGGKLTTSIKGHVVKSHDLELLDKRYQRFYSAGRIEVNSYHKSGILKKDLADGLAAWAVKDEIVEGFFHKDYPILAMQWHPERPGPTMEKDRLLIDALISNKFFCKKETA